MNELQKQLINIWKDVKSVTDNSKYHLIPWAGTLLGAVRHNGFIPWDDDMDFGYIGSDFNKLVEFLKNNLPSKYIISTITTKGTRHAWIQIYDSEHYSNVIEGGKKVYKHPFIDIFNLLNIKSPNGNTFKNRFWGEVNWAKNVKMFSSPQVIPIRPFLYLFSQKFLHKKIQKRAKKIEDKNGKYIYEYTSAYYKTFPKSLFEEYIDVKFEDQKISIPKGYDEILKIHYGDWHKIPDEKDRRTHIIKDK